MQNLQPVARVDRRDHLLGERQELRERQSSETGHVGFAVHAVDVFHADDLQLAVLDELVQLDDVGMIDGTQEGDFTAEAFEADRVLRQKRVENLQRNRRLGVQIESLIDRGILAAADGALDDETPGQRVAIGQRVVAPHATRLSSASTSRAIVTSSRKLCRHPSRRSTSEASNAFRKTSALPTSVLNTDCR